ncbi:hypothetical protein [Paenibacillus sp. MBLB4367]|uniref:glycan biosynthesis hexose transferase WsfD n=1 Tax=Paenibacillus sp. MBLB4367 TaxID=3384767 RepID=UPI0039083EAF
MWKKLLRLETAVLLATAFIVVYLLMVKPIIGVANNGDFERIMGTVGLADLHFEEPYAEKYFAYFHSKYAISHMGLGGYISTQLIAVFAAVGLNLAAYSRELFDIRFLSGLYAALLLGAFYLILRWGRTNTRTVNVVLAVLLVVVFADVGYLAYFNSLFGEPTTFVFLLLTIGFALAISRRSEHPTIGLLVCFFASAFMLVGSKIQYAPAGIIVALLGFRLWGLRADRKWKRTVAGLSAFLVLASAGFYLSAPKEISSINKYQTVFFGILKDSKTPERDLEQLGISPKLAVLAGTNYFTPDTPIKQNDPSMKPEFYDKISHFKVLGFYMTHPARFIQKLERAAENSMMIRPYYLGNYEKAEGKPAGKVALSYSFWSEFKKNALPNSLLSVVVLYVVYYGGLLLFWRRCTSPFYRFAAEMLAAVGAVGAIAFVTPLIGDGEADLGKHLFLYTLCYDVMLVTVVTGLVAAAVGFVAGRSSKRITPSAN